MGCRTYPMSMSLPCLALVLFATLASCIPDLQLGSASMDINIFATPVVVGAQTGFEALLVGCNDTGATLQHITVWANANFLRGVQATLTDGRTALWGCVDTTLRQSAGGDVISCDDADIRNASFTFSPAERIRSLTVWAGADKEGNSNARAGAIRFETSLGGVFDFGMTGQRPAEVIVDVGSGIPCGVVVRRGADIDAFGFVFLQNVTEAALTDLQYSGVPCDAPCVPDAASGPLFFGASPISLADENYTTNKEEGPFQRFTLVGKKVEDSGAQWSVAEGLDRYIPSNVSGPLPIVTAPNNSTDELGVALLPPILLPRSLAWKDEEDFRFSFLVPRGGALRVSVGTARTVVRTAYSGNLRIALASGAVLSVPVTGTFVGNASLPVMMTSTQFPPEEPPSPDVSALSLPSGGTRDMEAVPQSRSSGSHTGAIVGGVLGGILAALLLVLLVLLLERQRKGRTDSDEEYGKGGAKSGTVPGGPGSPALGVPVFFASKREGHEEGPAGKQPPSPIKGFTDVQLPESAASNAAQPPRPSRPTVAALVRSFFGIGQREQLDDLDPNEAYLELGEQSMPRIVDVANLGNEQAVLQGSKDTPACKASGSGRSSPTLSSYGASDSGSPRVPNEEGPSSPVGEARPAASPSRSREGPEALPEDVHYDPDTAHWTKPPVPTPVPARAQAAGRIEHENVSIRTSDRRRHIEGPEGEHLQLGSRE
eukprot:jgi/Botrbrau1/2331/Bobra.39_1s0020.1